MDVGRGLCRIGLHRWVAVRSATAALHRLLPVPEEQMLDLRPERFSGGSEGGFLGGGDRRCGAPGCVRPAP